MEQPDLVFNEKPGKNGDLGIITLNRPKVLNALNHSMFIAMHRQLKEWSESPKIKAVVITAAEGRAFCAGGDIRSAYERGKANDPTLPDFFGDEYNLNKYIYHYPKPYIALMDGITMGGGVGISIHGSHRVASERYVFAMPETGIGFYPDVGATYFLPRLTSKIGFYLGLTGEKIDCYESLAIGIVDNIIAKEMFSDVLEKIAETSLEHDTDATVSEILNQFALTPDRAKILDKQAVISTCFSKNTISEIINTLEHYPDAWCQSIAAIISTKSPTSLAVTLRQLQMGSKLTFDECMDLEFSLTCHFLKGHDFFEGVRAAIIDKDKNPRWKPAKVSEINEEVIAKYFNILIDSGSLIEDLKLDKL